MIGRRSRRIHSCYHAIIGNIVPVARAGYSPVARAPVQLPPIARAPLAPPVIADSFDERDEVWLSEGSPQPSTAESVIARWTSIADRKSCSLHPSVERFMTKLSARVRCWSGGANVVDANVVWGTSAQRVRGAAGVWCRGGCALSEVRRRQRGGWPAHRQGGATDRVEPHLCVSAPGFRKTGETRFRQQRALICRCSSGRFCNRSQQVQTLPTRKTAESRMRSAPVSTPNVNPTLSGQARDGTFCLLISKSYLSIPRRTSSHVSALCAPVSNPSSRSLLRLPSPVPVPGSIARSRSPGGRRPRPAGGGPRAEGRRDLASAQRPRH